MIHYLYIPSGINLASYMQISDVEIDSWYQNANSGGGNHFVGTKMQISEVEIIDALTGSKGDPRAPRGPRYRVRAIKNWQIAKEAKRYK